MTNGSRETPRVALYARVSSEGQERDETVQSQLEALRVYAGSKGYGQPAEFVDEARSGYTLVRPALDRLRDAVTSGAFDVVLIHEIGRLARDYADQALLLREIRKRARVEFVKHPTDDSPEGQLLENMLGAIANFEGRVIADRTRRGRQHWVEQGALVASGVPYGYRFVPRTAEHRATMEVDEAPASVVREIFAMLADEHMSCRATCRRLTERGTPAPKGGRIWHPSVLQRIVTNTAYIGRFVYGKNEAAEPQRAFKPVGERKRKRSSRNARPPEQWVTIPCAPIIDEETFQRAQAQLAANAQFSPRHNTRNAYLLRGLIRCGQCGGAFVGATTQGRKGRNDRYYRCNTRDPFNLGTRTVCRQPYLRADDAERTVWETCLDLLKPEVLAEEYRRRIAQDDHGGEAAEARKLQADLKAVERHERRWQDAYAAEAIDVATLKERMTGCRTQRQALEGRLAILADATSRRRQQAQVLDSLQAFCRQVGEGLEDADFARRQEVIRLMVERVVVEDGGRLRIELAIPLGGNGSGDDGQRLPEGAGPLPLYALRPGAVGTEKTDHLPGLDLQGDAGDGLDGIWSRSEAHAQILRADHRLHPPTPFSWMRDPDP
jgi:site-specific DNA recombinase